MDNITFTKNETSKNTFSDWGLIPVGPIDPPYLHTDKVRYGKLSFMMNYGDIPVDLRITDITEFFADGSINAEFSTDPGHTYTGKWDLLVSDTIGTGKKIELAYQLDEFKWEDHTIGSRWEWGNFNFSTGSTVKKAIFTDLTASSKDEFQPVSISESDLKSYIGDATVCPEFYNKSDSPMTFKVGEKVRSVPAGEKRQIRTAIFTSNADTLPKILVKGEGLYDIDFTKGVR